jgi:hypothetical protein
MQRDQVNCRSIRIHTEIVMVIIFIPERIEMQPSLAQIFGLF